MYPDKANSFGLLLHKYSITKKDYVDNRSKVKPKSLATKAN